MLTKINLRLNVLLFLEKNIFSFILEVFIEKTITKVPFI